MPFPPVACKVLKADICCQIFGILQQRVSYLFQHHHAISYIIFFFSSLGKCILGFHLCLKQYFALHLQSAVYQNLLNTLGCEHSPAGAPQTPQSSEVKQLKHLTIFYFSPPILDYPLLNLSLLFVCVCVCVIFVVKKAKAAPSLMAESGPLPANRGLQTFAKASKHSSPTPLFLCPLFFLCLVFLFFSV